MEKFRVLQGIDRRAGQTGIPRFCRERARKNSVAYHAGDYHRGIERPSDFQQRAVEKRRNGNGRCGRAAVSGPPAAGRRDEGMEKKDGGRRRRGPRKTLE